MSTVLGSAVCPPATHAVFASEAALCLCSYRDVHIRHAFGSNRLEQSKATQRKATLSSNTVRQARFEKDHHRESLEFWERNVSLCMNSWLEEQQTQPRARFELASAFKPWWNFEGFAIQESESPPAGSVHATRETHSCEGDV